MPAPVPFDRFVKFPELTELLQALAAEHPNLLDLSVIGRSYEDREIWLCTLTNTDTGPHHEKPALWIDANIHSTEHTGGAAALHLVHKLVSEYGADPKVTRVLDTRCFYIVPRLNPDGAELALAERPRYVRSSVRPFPRTDQQDGLVAEDVDGDGRILTMRIPDPNGTWKVYAEDPRLMVPRDPDDDDAGTFYRLLQEGTVQNYDGVTIKYAPALHGLDMNRNYPVDWRVHGEQAGAGPYPTSEPEIRATVQAIVDRPNICGYIQYHTMSGVHLRPYSTKSDEGLPTLDLRVYKKIGEKATELTGYPAVSVFHDFRYDPKDVITGVGHEWAYDHVGVFAWTTEFWNPFKTAGIDDYKFIEWGVDHPFDDDLKVLAWVDENLGEDGFVPWYPFDHPQLGPVEIGGWNSAHFIRNPPPHLLEAEIAPHADLAIFHLLISPLIRQRELTVTPVGDDTWRVRLVVENTGWLPTNVTQKAVEKKAVLPLEAELTLPAAAVADGAEVIGDAKLDLGQLGGRVMKHSMLGGFGAVADATHDRAKADWVVRAPAGTVATVEARHPRAGVVRATVTLV